MMDFQLEEIKALRVKFGLTQFQLAQKAGVSQSLIAKLESKRIDPAYSKVKQIFDTLKTLTAKEELKSADIMNKRIISAKSNEGVDLIIKKMKMFKISQLPILDKDNIIGIVSEESILDVLKDGKQIKDLTAKEVMLECPPTIPEDTPMSVISSILKFHSLVLVKKKGKLSGLITKADLLRKF